MSSSASAKRTITTLCMSAAIVLLVVRAGAQPLDLQSDLQSLFTNYAVTRWDVSEGAPDGSIFAIVQDPNGYLWIGSEVGLYRFDGMRFVPWRAISSHRLPDGPVQALHVS